MAPPMTRFEVAVLGRTTVTADGAPVALRPREASVAAALALTGRVTSATELADLVWPAPPASALKSLHNHIARLRRAADVVITDPDGYRLASDVALDRERFESLVARRDPDPARADALAELLARWQGPAFASLDDHPDLDVERARLDELRWRAEEQVVGLRLLAGAEPAIAAAAEELAAAQPYREHRWWLLMLARHRAGRRRDALAAYQQARDALVAGAGIEPGAALRALEAQVLADDPALATATPLIGAEGPFTATPNRRSHEHPRLADLIGRGADLDRLEAHATGAEPGVLVVVGDAGAGKTSLADAAARALRARGILVLRTAGDPMPEGPLAPVERVVTQLVATHGVEATRSWASPDDLPALARLVPALDTGAGADAPLAGPVDAAVARLLAAACDHQPHLVVVDDAHLVQPSSARVLAALPEAAGASLLLLARPGPLPVPFASVDGEVHHLAGLDHRGVADYVAASIGAPVAPDVVEHLRRRSGGNPLLLGEIVATPAVRDALAADRDVGAVAQAEEVSDTVAAFARHRLAELAAGTARAIEAAAAIGATGERTTLEGVIGPVGDHLGAAIEAGLLAEHDEGDASFEFRHHLIRDAVLLSVGPGARAELHDAIAHVLSAGPAPSWARIAHHRLAAADQDPDAALDACQRAAAEAFDQFAYREAAELRATERDLLVRFGRGEGPEMDDATIDEGEALHLAGDPAGGALLLAAADHAEASGDVDRAGRALLCLCRLGLSTDAGPADPDLAARIDRVLDGDLRPDVAAELAGTASLLHSLDPDPRRCRELFDRAEETARAQAPQVLPRVLPYAYLGLAHPDQLDRRAAIAEELVSIAPDPGARFSGMHQRFSVQVQRGDAGFRETHAEMERLAERMSDPGHRWTVAYNAACVHHLDGDLEAAEAAATASLATDGIALSRRIATYGVQLVALRRAQGRLAELAEPVERLLHDQPEVKGWRAVAVATAAAAGDLPAVRAGSDALAEDGHAGVPDDYTRSGAALLAVEAVTATGDTDRIARDLPLLDDLRGRLSWVGTTTLGSIDLVAGRAELALGDVAAARASFTAALHLGRRLGAPRIAEQAADGLDRAGS